MGLDGCGDNRGGKMWEKWGELMVLAGVWLWVEDAQRDWAAAPLKAL